MSKRAAIYARVSTEDQAEKGYSLPSQITACRAHAARLGYTVTAEFQEDYSGATAVNDRPQGRVLAEMVRRRAVDAVIVNQVDRLSRDIVDLLVAVRAWLAAGVEVYAGDVGQIDSEHDIVLVIKGWQGSDERKRIRERSMRGKRAKANAGMVIGGRATYGYKHVRDAQGRIATYEPTEPEAGIVRLIYQWYVYGDEDGQWLSIKEIARRLTRMGAPTPGEVHLSHRKRETITWYPHTLQDILTNEAYAGVWWFGGRIGGTRNMRPVEERIPVSVPPIIDRKTWELAQEQRERNKRFAKRNAKRQYLLSGLVKCGACNTSMVGSYFNHHRYHMCGWRNSHHEEFENACRAGRVRADILEADIWGSVLKIFQDTDWLNAALLDAQAAELQAFTPKREELQTVTTMIEEAEREAVQIGAALARVGGLVGKTLQDSMTAINQRYEALCSRRDELLAGLEEQRLTDDAIGRIVQFAEDVRAGMENADYQTARHILEVLKVEVIIKDRRFYVTSLAGEWDGDISKTVYKSGDVGIENVRHWR